MDPKKLSELLNEESALESEDGVGKETSGGGGGWGRTKLTMAGVWGRTKLTI